MYVIREHFFSFGDDFDVLDEHGNKVLHVDGKVFTVRDKVVIEDLNGVFTAQLSSTVAQSELVTATANGLAWHQRVRFEPPACSGLFSLSEPPRFTDGASFGQAKRESDNAAATRRRFMRARCSACVTPRARNVSQGEAVCDCCQ